MVLSGNNEEEASHCSRCERIRSPGSQQARYKDNAPDVIDAASRAPVRRWFADSHQTLLHVRRPTHNILDWRSGVCLPMNGAHQSRLASFITFGARAKTAIMFGKAIRAKARSITLTATSRVRTLARTIVAT